MITAIMMVTSSDSLDSFWALAVAEYTKMKQNIKQRVYAGQRLFSEDWYKVG